MIRFYRIPLSTNVERVALALAHKALSVESVGVNPEDRTEVRRVSGQDLVPVIEDGDTVVADSTAIIEYLEAHYPDRPLFPTDPARRAEMRIFIDWFNRVWKRPPNEIVMELGKPGPDPRRIERLGRAMTEALDLFEGMLQGRAHLMGEAFSAADCAAFPFLKFALLGQGMSDYLFHQTLVKYQPLGESHPRLTDWIRRVDARPRV